ncbi:MAG: FeoA family protein [candidate division Zixibacteria bacterium]|nr:FeoA family protein [candidate division Zixibacteria bacterium]
MTSLDKMSPGQKGKLVGFTGDTLIARRLTEMGLAPGREITYLRKAPLRDPIVVRVGGGVYSLRQIDAAQISVELEREIVG